jgi:hypothetical protein
MIQYVVNATKSPELAGESWPKKSDDRESLFFRQYFQFLQEIDEIAM